MSDLTSDLSETRPPGRAYNVTSNKYLWLQPSLLCQGKEHDNHNYLASYEASYDFGGLPHPELEMCNDGMSRTVSNLNFNWRIKVIKVDQPISRTAIWICTAALQITTSPWLALWMDRMRSGKSCFQDKFNQEPYWNEMHQWMRLKLGHQNEPQICCSQVRKNLTGAAYFLFNNTKHCN